VGGCTGAVGRLPPGRGRAIPPPPEPEAGLPPQELAVPAAPLKVVHAAPLNSPHLFMSPPGGSSCTAELDVPSFARQVHVHWSLKGFTAERSANAGGGAASVAIAENARHRADTTAGNLGETMRASSICWLPSPVWPAPHARTGPAPPAMSLE
jgi:hypothetical protein